MARALIAVGVAGDRAYQLARRIELDLAEAGEPSLGVDRFEVLAARSSARTRARRPSTGCDASPTCSSSTCR